MANTAGADLELQRKEARRKLKEHQQITGQFRDDVNLKDLTGKSHFDGLVSVKLQASFGTREPSLARKLKLND